MRDEVAPIGGVAKDPFGRWAATLLDSLDTLWIMGMRRDFNLAVTAAINISFEMATIDEVNVFETIIRFLGGFLPAYDLSGDKRLLRKAKEVGDMLYAAFDTPNRMPVTRWRLLVCFVSGMLAIASKLFNIPNHLDKAQKLVDGCIWAYQAPPLGIMSETFHLVPCPSPGGTCSWNETHWKQELLQKHGIDPEDMGKADSIAKVERLPKGFTTIGDTRYILRPEAVESVFVLYRITGRKDFIEATWAMFEAREINT